MTQLARSCINCACFARMLADGSLLARDATDAEAQTVCRRTPPNGRWVRMDVPVFDKDTGAPVMARNGQQRSEPRQVLQVGYPPTVETGVCFDGWRPIETLPGENHNVAGLVPLVHELANMLLPAGRVS